MVKVDAEIALPIAVRIRDLEPNQVALQVDQDNVWMRVGDKLLFTPRVGKEGWFGSAHDNMKIFVNPFPRGTQLTFFSCR